jgi:uncharacterized membrane protein YbhN (UPF0104 family)
VRRAHLAVLGLVAVVAGAAAFAVTGTGQGGITSALHVLRDARPGWVFVAAVCCGCALLCSAAAWRVGLHACGGRACFSQTAARYAVGSLVNSVAPAHLGGAARIALMSRTLPGQDGLWRASGVGVAVGAARGLTLALLVVAAAALGEIPFWPAPLVAAAVVGVFLLGSRAADRFDGHVGSLLRVFGTLGRADGGGLRLLGWICGSAVARVAAACAAATALGIGRPLWVGVVLLGAVALSGMIPLTPGNLGAGAGAATIALHGVGVGLGQALALGVAFQAIETVASVTLGLLGTAQLAAPGTPARRFALAGGLAAMALVAGTLGIVAVDIV